MRQEDIIGWMILGFAAIGASCVCVFVGDAMLAFVQFAVLLLQPAPDPKAGEVWGATVRQNADDPVDVYVISVHGDWIKYGWWWINPYTKVPTVWTTEESPLSSFKKRFRMISAASSDI